jgi:urocanate hydratase
MAVHNVIGDAFRGATWVSLHNGGGVGWGEAINGGFGMVIDGSAEAERRIRGMIAWDVDNGLARRAWAGKDGARLALSQAMSADGRLRVTLPYAADEALVERALAGGSRD